MKRRVMLFWIVVIVAAAAISGCKKEEAIVVTADYLAASKWGPSNGRYGWYIEFRKDGTYDENFAGEGCGGYKGTYAIANNAVVLNTNQKDACTPDQKPVVNRKCVVEKDDKGLYRDVKMVCDGLFGYHRQDSVAAADRQVDIQGVPAVSMGARNAVVKETVMFRVSPDKSGKVITCKGAGPDEKSSSALPKGMQLIVLARTKEKARVGNWENYWYYVDPNIDWYSSCDAGEGWVFGEFIEMK